MANNADNIIPNSERTAEERKAIARAGGIASGKARRERKTIAESLRALLDEQDENGISRLDKLTAKCLTNTFKKGEIKDLRTLTEILGELKQTVSLDGNALVISVKDNEEKKDVEDIINREQ